VFTLRSGLKRQDNSGLMTIEQQRTMRVLLIEDEPAAAQMLAKGLREHGYAVDLVADGEEGLEKVHTNQYGNYIHEYNSHQYLTW